MSHWIVFDYGEVLCTRTTAVPKLAAVTGVPAEDFEPVYWELREPYDRGSTDLAYWTAIGERLGVQVDEALSAELTALDVAGWSHLTTEALDLLESLAEAGASLALLSNASVTFGAWVREQEWAKLFRHTMFSGDVRCAKPDAEIYRLLLAQLGAEPGECLFFDDRASNVDGARAVGLRAHVWNGAEAARAALG
ncbi:putative hydrolase of the HAD superfamily [Amycolatopsis sulphurea]|uniref:Putative hydrolase of the HAD superfamily n=1 Tax=Amycolatopsis sulphurea TaxID=76022 RepID=A0A2A9FDR4_9PSEU|nr:HAD family phosphatase [Amycolatopsis sulphurea]PFG48555.1 putative hydrolase of the HAD superfamily [Amycolatopsis sulphurea]